MENRIRITNENGEEKVFDVLFSFDSENTGKTYVVYTDNQREDKTIKCYASVYEDGKLSAIDTEAENQIVEAMINTIAETAKIKYELVKE